MTAIEKVVLDHIQNEPSLSGAHIGVEVTGGGLFKRRKVLHLFGSAHTTTEKERAAQIAMKEAGDNFDIVNDISIK